MPKIWSDLHGWLTISQQRGPDADEDLAGELDEAAALDMQPAELAEAQAAAHAAARAEGIAAGRAHVAAVARAVLKGGGKGEQILAAMDLAVEAPEMSVESIARFCTRPTLSSLGFPGPPPGASARLADRDKYPNSLDLALAELKAEDSRRN